MITNRPDACSPPDSQEIVLRTLGLSKKFGKIEAVRDLNLELRRGEVFGFLGPNGAGKSTTVGMVLGLVAPTSGDIELFGQRLNGDRRAALRRVGAIIEEPSFYPYLSGRDNLEVLVRAVGGIRRDKVDEVLSRVNLLDRASDKYSTYSMGMKQRLGIASTLLKDPELIILDEPTNGLDPAGTKEVRDLIPRLAHESRAVFLCSHLLHEVELICNRVAIIKQGKLLECAPMAELTNKRRGFEVEVEDIAAAEAVLKSLSWVKSVHREERVLLVDAPGDSGSRLNQALAESHIFASSLLVRSSSLEDVFLDLTGGRDNV
ncbi:MAG: ATP-binding cassette domain-containing protein [Chloroflexi bacterium]|nr:ATP-binding cassette domain-containing protein [Chloroflexota bacterium]